MRSLAIYFLLICTPIAALAQADSSTTSRWSISTISTHLSQFEKWDAPVSTFSEYQYSNRLTLRLGMQVNFMLSKKVRLSTGGAYAIRDYAEEYKCLNCDILSTTPTEIRLRYFDIPLIASYTLKEGKISVHALGGFTNSFLVQAWRTYHYIDLRPDQTFVAEEYYKEYLLSAEIGVRSHLSLSKHFGIDAALSYSKPLFQPTFESNLTWSTLQSQLGLSYQF